MQAHPPYRHLLLPICLALSAGAGCARPPEVLLYRAAGEPVHVRVEIATSPQELARGLMYRRDLPADSGMLFVFAAAGNQTFWMKNTLFPLDIIFIGADRRIVNIAENTIPFSTTAIPSGRPAQYVLEVNGGFARRHGIRRGDRVAFPAIVASE